MKNIYLVGTVHHNSQCNEVLKEYAKKASEKKVIVCLEGFPSDPEQAFNLAQKSFNISSGKGYIFGCESEIVNALAGLLLHLGYCRHVSMTKEAEMGNLQTIFDIMTIKEMKNAWNSFNWDLELCKKINNIIQNNEYSDVKYIINKIYNENREILLSKDWLKIYPQLFDAFERQIINVPIVSDLYSKLDKNKIKGYLEGGENTDYIVNEINGNFRDQFIIQNIVKVIEEKKELNIDIYIFIGESHVENIFSHLQKMYTNVYKIVLC